MSGKTVKEDREAKEAKRRQKERERLKRHVVRCPHCGKDALDHMTACPHCGGELIPQGYRPADPAKMKKIKTVCYAVFIAIALLAVVLVIVYS